MADLKAVVAVENIRYDRKAEALYILDQSLLPGEEKEIRLRTVEEMVEAIRALRVRGAPAIGICAAYCMYVLAKSIRTEDRQVFLRELSRYGQILSDARPTAVNLSWAIREMMRTALEHLNDPRGPMLDALYVRPQARGRGCGRALVETFCDMARADGAREMDLKVLTGNHAARTFYESLGFGDQARHLRRQL